MSILNFGSNDRVTLDLRAAIKQKKPTRAPRSERRHAACETMQTLHTRELRDANVRAPCVRVQHVYNPELHLFLCGHIRRVVAVASGVVLVKKNVRGFLKNPMVVAESFIVLCSTVELAKLHVVVVEQLSCNLATAVSPSAETNIITRTAFNEMRMARKQRPPPFETLVSWSCTRRTPDRGTARTSAACELLYVRKSAP